jgi:alpha,alpha-trehalose phosphorylase
MRGPRFEVDPWAIMESGLDLGDLGVRESVFALSNGHIGLRGNLDEGEPAEVHGTYLNGLYETRPLPYAETVYGNPEDGQTMINVVDGKLFRMLVDDEPLDLRYGEIVSHARTLDMRAGVLRRELEWQAPSGQHVRVRSTRLVSFTHRSIAAFEVVIEPVGASARIVAQSELVANQPVPEQSGDPRAAAALAAPLEAEQHGHHELRAGLLHCTRASRIRVASAMDHVVDGPEGTLTSVESHPDLARLTVTTELQPGEQLRIMKVLAYGWSSRRPTAALRDQTEAALASAFRTGWDGLLADQSEYLDRFWEGADIEIDGDPELQQAVRFAIFSVLQASARAEVRAIPAKGLTGRGYDGHTFWDQEIFVLPALTYTAPDAAADALRWRHSTMDLAQSRAHELGLRGAAFPWRTIRGQECSGYWPAGTAAFHVNADIAEAVRRYLTVTQDEAFAAGPGIDLLVETARLWCSIGHHDTGGAFRIDGVTGPDEYSALADNNVYTNLLAARNLRLAANAVGRHPERAGELGVRDEEVASWRRAADAMRIPFDAELGVHPQAEGFTRQRRWKFDPEAEHPLLLHLPYYLLYSSQVCKQADLVHALYLAGESFSPEHKARDFAFYEAITVRDSSLSASIQAIVAAETGHIDLALDYLAETALVDLHDLADNTSGGVHLAALGGAWLAVVAGFGGMRDHDDGLAFSPRLPEGLDRVAFRLRYRGRRLRVEIGAQDATYELLDGEEMPVHHHGEWLELELGKPLTRPVPPSRAPQPVQQPPGREPARRAHGERVSVAPDE